jgi:tetratricopeptide (TPR) repeat protein
MEDAYRELLEQALEKARLKENATEEAKILIDLAFWHEDASDLEKAAELFEAGLRHLKSSPQYITCLPAMFNLAQIYQSRQKEEKAFTLYGEIAELAEKGWEKAAQGRALAFKGDILLRQGAYENGLESMFRGFQILEEARLKESKPVHNLIAQWKKRIPRGIFDLALTRSRISQGLKEELAKDK